MTQEVNLIRPLTASEAEISTTQSEIEGKIGKKVQRRTAFLIAVIAQILEENKQFGKVTVRQVYYQLVSRGVIENSKKSYQSYVHHLTTGRKGAVIPWDAFEDRSRMYHKEPSPRYDVNEYEDPEEELIRWFEYALRPQMSDEYDLPRWEDQPYYVEVWVEKDALAGFLTPLCERLGVGLVVSRGYTSYTFKQEAIRRFQDIEEQEGKKPILLYLGDLDPSGYDIYRCLKDEIIDVRVERLGLHSEDVGRFGLVPNLLKERDTRSKGFKNRYPELGNMVYELDALPPGELTGRTREGVMQYFNEAIFRENQQRVRHWRANFTDHQEKIMKVLKKSGIIG
jgi:hypothetical protein